MSQLKRCIFQPRSGRIRKPGTEVPGSIPLPCTSPDRDGTSSGQFFAADILGANSAAAESTFDDIHSDRGAPRLTAFASVAWTPSSAKDLGLAPAMSSRSLLI